MDTKFFHRQTEARLWKNKVSTITNGNGEEISDQKQIKEEAFRHFEKLYKNTS